MASKDHAERGQSISGATTSEPNRDTKLAQVETKRPNLQLNSFNVMCGIISFFIPGLGQLFQRRVIPAFLFFLAAVVSWLGLLGWIFHFISGLEAMFYRKRLGHSQTKPDSGDR